MEEEDSRVGRWEGEGAGWGVRGVKPGEHREREHSTQAHSTS